MKILFEHAKEHSSEGHEVLIRDWLGGAKECRDCLFFAVEHNNADMLTYLLEEVKLGKYVNEKNENGLSLLHIAAKNGNERIIFELAGDKSYGADVNAEDKQSNKPLHIAAAASQTSAARFLISL